VATSTDSSTALQEGELKIGAGLSSTLQASSAATAGGTTVEGTATGTAEILQAVGALNNPIEVGAQASLQVIQTAVAKADAVTVNGATSTAIARLDDGTGGGTAAGPFGGIIDTAATAKDLSIGSAGQIQVSVDDSATATALNTAGAATANAITAGVDGLFAISAAVGTSGSLQAQVDTDLSAAATTVGTAPGSGDATALASAVRVAAITADDPTKADPSTISFGAAGSIKASAGVIADPIALAATATSVATPASATTRAGQVAAITDQLTTKGTIESGAALALDVSGVTSQVARATSVEGNATAASGFAGTLTDNGDVLFGAQIGTLSVGTDAALLAVASGNLAAAATTTAGDAEAAAALPRAMAANFKDFEVGTAAKIQTQADVILDAKATSTGGAATAASEVPDGKVSGGVAGFQATGSLAVGTEAQLDGLASLKAAATAVTVAGAAEAKAGSDQADSHGVIFINALGDFGIGGDAQLRGIASSTLTATAQTVGAVGAAADATAQAGGQDGVAGNAPVITVGLDFNGQSLGLGQAATLTGSADLLVSALAQTVTGDGQAEALSDRSVGLQSNLPLSVGENALIDARAGQQTTARAITVDGQTTAVNTSALLAGVNQDAGATAALSVGTDLSFNAQASGNATAIASSIDAGAGGSAAATVNQDSVFGTFLGGTSPIQAGASASLRSGASSIQAAQASNFGPAGTPNNGAVTADVAGADLISGVRTTAVEVGTNLTGFTARASLDGQASSSNVAATGLSAANVGVTGGGVNVQGIFGGDISVGGTAAGPVGIDSQATATLQATSRAISGAATSTVGAADALVLAIGDSDLKVGTQLPLLAQSQAVSTADAGAVTGIATGLSNLSSIGLQNSSLEVGTSGQVRALASLSNTVLARSVFGNSVTTGDSLVQAINNTDMGFGAAATLTFNSSSQGRVNGESVAGGV
jgi:hypothetical protein